MSIPSSCHTDTVSNAVFRPKKQATIPNLVLMLFSPVNTEMLRSWTLDSIHSIRVQFFQGRSTNEVQILHRQVESMQHRRLLVVFFALLNIESTLKHRLVENDDVRNTRKIARFLVDLKHNAITQFFSTELMSPSEFVDACEELYVIA